MVTYLHTYEPKNYPPTSLVMIDDIFNIKPLTTSSSMMIFMIAVLTLAFVIVSPMLKLRKCSMLAIVVLVVVTSQGWPLPRKSCMPINFGLLSLAIVLRQSNTIPISSYTPLRHKLHLLPSIPLSQSIISINGLLT